jgi:hypothetical protein
MNFNSRDHQAALRRLPVVFLLCLIFPSLALASEPQKYWVFFHDKGSVVLTKNSAAMQEARSRLSPRALARRAKVMPPDRLITEEDLPIAAAYVAALHQRGFEIIRESRWLNGVSILATEEEAEALRDLPFVKEVRRVAQLRHPPEPEAEVVEPPALFKTAAHTLDYGSSLAQNEQINVPALHDAGITGRGVLVGMLDSGFHYQDHEALRNVKIVAEYDFVNDDGVTRNETGQDQSSTSCTQDQDCHGTITLAVIGAYYPGNLIGPAFGAEYLLAKTEHIPTETRAEEDNWAEAIEWMEAQGVDVASSSLGYGKFDGGVGNYTVEDMDGNTTIITRAADRAAARGVVVVNSAGNQDFWPQIDAPADGDSVLAVGAVTINGQRSSFSSIGPTADGRIKPDVAALGSGVRTVLETSTNSLTTASGTSLACPLVAGVAAQILSAHPDLTAAQVFEALRYTASQADAPDNNLGYGIVNARAAITYWGPAFSNFPEVDSLSSSELRVTVRILSRAGLQSNQTFLYYAGGASTNFTPVAMTQIDSILYAGIVPKSSGTDTVKVYFSTREVNASVDAFYPPNAPAEFLRLSSSSASGFPPAPYRFGLLQNYPNPLYDGTTTIRFHVETAEALTVKIFNQLGQEVTTLVSNRVFLPGVFLRLRWDGRDATGKKVAAGIYFYQLSAGGRRLVRKMMLLR